MPSGYKRNGNRQANQLSVFPSSLLPDLDNMARSSSLSQPPESNYPVIESESSDFVFDPGLEGVEELADDNVPSPILLDDPMTDDASYYGRVRGETESPPRTLEELTPSSPPYRVVDLKPSVEPIPISVRPPDHRAPMDEGRAGHTRSPILAREPTMLENFSRTVRNYVPSSIPIPTASPSPPLVSRPVSFGSFMTTPSGTIRIPSTSGTANHGRRVGSSAADRERLNSRISSEHGTLRERERQFSVGDADEGVFASDEDEEDWSRRRGLTTYPRAADEGDTIVWARWDELGGTEMPRRLLFLAYSSGLQIWDCTNLGSVSEMLNLVGADWGHISYAATFSHPPSSKDDPLVSDRPLIGIVTTIRNEPTLLVYSLYRHHVVKRLALPGLDVFLSNERFIVISTTNPPTLHILSAVTFDTLFTVPSTSLLSFYPAHLANPTNINTSNINNINSPVSILSSLDPSYPAYSQSMFNLLPPQPVFALSHRLLAYASPPPLPSSTVSVSVHRPRTRSPSSGATSSSPFSMSNMTQAELGNAALKVGGSVLSGMKSLGGMAYSAAKSRAGPLLGQDQSVGANLSASPGPSLGQSVVGSLPTVGGLTNRFFSRSAPAAASAHERGRRYSTTSVFSSSSNEVPEGGHSLPDHVTTAVPRTTPAAPETGNYITVVDLAPLLKGASCKPTVVAEFLASKRQPISDVKFSSDGNSVMVTPKDGQVLQVFQIRPMPLDRGASEIPASPRLPGLNTKLGSPSSRALSRSPPRSNNLDCPWHVYNLRRGRTSAIVEGVDWAHDGRWVAIGTRKRTVHVFAVNPYGGKPDQRSHIEGRVRNSVQLQPLSTEINPLVRLRVLKTPAPNQLRVPLAFTFVRSSEASVPSNLLPPVRSPSFNTMSIAGTSDSGSEPISPHHYQRPSNFQDILVFDPTDGILSLRRFTLDLRPHDQVLSSMSSFGSTSIPLPGVSAAGRPSVSPASSGSRSSMGRTSGLTQMMQPPTDLTARENVVATWSLQRRHDWGEIRRVIESEASQGFNQEQVEAGDWLYQAELSTYSKSPQILPRSIYLSHQFSFHTLGEDYHALIRRYQFDIGGSNLNVRKKVEVSAYSGVGESFVEGYSAPQDVRRAASSFDEPLASALGAGLEYSLPPAVLPMLPNGTPGSKPMSYRSSIPIRTMTGLSDGMTEGLGRIRREIHKVRSPKLVPKPDSSMADSVPLEFDEEDEDFLTRESHPGDDNDSNSRSRNTSQGGDGSGATVSTPATSAHPLDDVDAEVRDQDDGDDVWQGWDPEDKQAVEDAERFDDISVLGFLDEERASVGEAEMKWKGRKA